MRILAYAKLNLGLRVSAPRPDGYHFIISLFQTITLHDVLDIQTRPEPGSSLAVQGLSVPADEHNLVTRAYRALQDVLPFGVNVTLTKQIPTGAGLGGGSADAAVFLLAMQHLCPTLSDSELAHIAPRLGADVPFFLIGGAALVEGIGESVRAVSPPRYAAFLIFFPGVGVATAEAYRTYDALQTFPQSWPPGSVEACMSGEDLVNDLETAVLHLHPEFERVLQLTHQIVGRRPAMSGSGSTFFLPFYAWLEAEEAKSALADQIPWEVRVVRPTSGSYSIQA